MSFFKFFSITELPDLELDKYQEYDAFSPASVLNKQEVFLSQLYKFSMHSGVKFHLLYMFDNKAVDGNKFSIIFFASAEREDDLNGLDYLCKNSILNTYFKFHEIVNSSTKKYIENKLFSSGSVLTKDFFSLKPLNNNPSKYDLSFKDTFSIKDWNANTKGRLYAVLKLMQGIDEPSAIRIDIHYANSTLLVNDLDKILGDLNARIRNHKEGKDYNSEILANSINEHKQKFIQQPFFFANIVAFSNYSYISNLLLSCMAAESIQSGNYRISDISLKDKGYSLLYGSEEIMLDLEVERLINKSSDMNAILKYVSCFSVSDLKSIFSFPILYPGEQLDIRKESEPRVYVDSSNSILLGKDERNHSVFFPLKDLSKHAFITGVPGSGKTNTMLHIISELWLKYNIPFLVFEPTKKEYRALFNITNSKIKEISLFSPCSDTLFPLHVNPFMFPKGMALSTHLSNLENIFECSFELEGPTAIILKDSLIRIYKDKGWKMHQPNEGNLEYPTMSDLYYAFSDVMLEYNYDNELRSRIQTFLEIRIGSLTKGESGDVFNVSTSSITPENWINKPAIIELESLGQGTSNFLVLLISTFIRETLDIRKINGYTSSDTLINHVIFYEEAHNLIGVKKENLEHERDPKVAATKYITSMLAEVRALKECIVIADQLPSVMAPEVLKNTGLKMVHRLTAEDDRQMICGTMLASKNQNNELVTYSQGKTLVFYEKLLKPFRLHVCKWQDNDEMYYSKSNSELALLLHDTEVYKDNLLASFHVEIDNIFRVAANLETELFISESNNSFIKFKNKTNKELKFTGNIVTVFLKDNQKILNSMKDELEEYLYISNKFSNKLKAYIMIIIYKKYILLWGKLGLAICKYINDYDDKQKAEIYNSIIKSFNIGLENITQLRFNSDNNFEIIDKDDPINRKLETEIRRLIEVVDSNIKKDIISKNSKNNIIGSLKQLLL